MEQAVLSDRFSFGDQNLGAVHDEGYLLNTM